MNRVSWGLGGLAVAVACVSMPVAVASAQAGLGLRVPVAGRLAAPLARGEWRGTFALFDAKSGGEKVWGDEVIDFRVGESGYFTVVLGRSEIDEQPYGGDGIPDLEQIPFRKWPLYLEVVITPLTSGAPGSPIMPGRRPLLAGLVAEEAELAEGAAVGAVMDWMIAAGAVDWYALADGAITADLIRDKQISDRHIVNEGISKVRGLGDEQFFEPIESAKIRDESVTRDEIKNLSISPAGLIDLTCSIVTTTLCASGQMCVKTAVCPSGFRPTWGWCTQSFRESYRLGDGWRCVTTGAAAARCCRAAIG